MCLFVIKNSVSQTSDEDITVYKVLRIIDDKYISPYRKTKYELGPVKCPKFKHTSTHINKNFSLFDEVNLGIHTFTNLDDAKVLVSQNSVPRIFELVIVECTIPKGTPLFKGKWISATGPIKSYASESLVLNKIVEN